MTSLTDLFNPTFFMFLGILILIVAVLVVYFETKMRDQNHKIASMLSLVSTLAEDMNGVKMGLNHLAIRGGHNQDIHLRENLGNNFENNLIEVSDEEESDNGETDNEEADNEEAENEESDNEDSDNKDSDNEDSDNEESDNEETDNEEIKVIKLQVSNEDLIEDDDSYEEANFEIDDKFKTDDNNFQEVLEDILKFPNSEIEKNIPSSSDLKKISINLGEVHEENIDYKKLQLPKLRSIVVEKGLISNSESIKLKKPELLKLLGVFE